MGVITCIYFTLRSCYLDLSGTLNWIHTCAYTSFLCTHSLYFSCLRFISCILTYALLSCCGKHEESVLVFTASNIIKYDNINMFNLVIASCVRIDNVTVALLPFRAMDLFVTGKTPWTIINELPYSICKLTNFNYSKLLIICE